MRIKSLLKKIVKSYISYRNYKECGNQFSVNIKKNGFENTKAVGEDDYIKFWRQFSNLVDPYSYRFYSHYLKENKRIIPGGLGNAYIEKYLNPERYRTFYSDKNLYNQYLHPETAVPQTIICRINGGELLDRNFQLAKMGSKIVSYESSAEEVASYIGDIESVVLKPSIDSKGGSGVKLFKKKNGLYISNNQEVLTGGFLLRYGRDFIVQETISQHPFFSQFNPTSVNTMRLCTYRSVCDEEVILFGAALRIGAKGSIADNTHNGGRIVGIDIATGKLGHTTFGEYRRPYDCWNDIDFKESEFLVPYWDAIVEFAKSIASQNHHMRLISLDIALKNDNKPILIEYNVNGFSFGLPICLNQVPFGNRFDEVMDYCLCCKKEEC